VIDQPYLKERYMGWPGGASLNGAPITTSNHTALEQATISTTDADLFTDEERPAFNRILSKVQLVRYGMDCYAYAIVASGHMDVVIESGLKPYDMMALIPVVRGAGGVATNWEGGTPGPCGRIVASGTADLHAAVLATLSE
jgi:myo-inositol-1(or 4)-monophosphatase